MIMYGRRTWFTRTMGDNTDIEKNKGARYIVEHETKATLTP